MIKTHEIDLSTSVFNQFEKSDYIILEVKTIEVNDYILFKQTEEIEGEISYTELHRLVQVKDIVKHQGLKEGYALLIVTKL